VFRLGADLKVYLHREPIDFRAGINSLAVLVQEVMELDPFAPAVFAFCNRRHDRMKLLFFDRERDEQPTAFGVDGIAIALSFRTSALPASA